MYAKVKLAGFVLDDILLCTGVITQKNPLDSLSDHLLRPDPLLWWG